jgi:hypothetical protein
MGCYKERWWEEEFKCMTTFKQLITKLLRVFTKETICSHGISPCFLSPWVLSKCCWLSRSGSVFVDSSGHTQWWWGHGLWFWPFSWSSQLQCRDLSPQWSWGGEVHAVCPVATRISQYSLSLPLCVCSLVLMDPSASPKSSERARSNFTLLSCVLS